MVNSSHLSQEDTGVESGDSICPDGNVDNNVGEESQGENTRDPENQLSDGDFEALSKNDQGWRKIVRNFTPSYVPLLSSNLPLCTG